jgi:dimethylhistidine N-methyltransferase
MAVYWNSSCEVVVSNASAPNRSETTDRNDHARGEVLRGLGGHPKHLPCKLFYDTRGSELFERICELDEYYLTRTELRILRASIDDIAAAIGPERVLVEYGSGAAVKTRLLLDALKSPVGYIPIDICRSALRNSQRILTALYPSLWIRPVCADYTLPLELPTFSHRIAAFFPGSTIGNFDPPAAVQFLKRIHTHVGVGGKLLIGVDLKKDKRILEAAYADREGITAEFNLNILRVLNREYNAYFSLESFGHRALWNERQGRVEMHLVSKCRQSVQVDSMTVRLEAGETILTEYCYKYQPDEFRDLSQQSGFSVERVWVDEHQLFSVQLLSAC